MEERKMFNVFKKKMLRALAGVAITLSGTTGMAADYQINISGATLFNTFFPAKAQVNDFIDVDNDTIKGYNGGTPDLLTELTNTGVDPNGTTYTHNWEVQYFGVGSGNGLKAMDLYYNVVPPFPTIDPNTGNYVYHANFPLPNPGVYDQSTFANGSTVSSPGIASNPGGAPLVPNNVDIAVMDVPTSWFIQVTGTAAFDKKPLAAGYGTNPVTSWNTGYTNKVKTLSNVEPVGGGTSKPDVYDTQIAWVPVAVIANRGTGLDNVTFSQVQYLFITGRMPNGENLNAGGRDSGSGTRNAFMNSFGIDPSWGRADNLGSQLKTDTGQTKLGSIHQYCNLDSTGFVEKAVKNNRLSVGYVGLDTAATKGAKTGDYEVLNVAKVGTNYVRPSTLTVVDNTDPNLSYQIGGSETMATVGDPMATYVNTNYPNLTSNPEMSNKEAAKYIRNIVESIAAFESAPGDVNTAGMPGELLAVKFCLNGALEYVPSASDPTVFVANTDYNATLNSFTETNNTSLNPPAYGSKNIANKVPERLLLTSPSVYSDGTDGSFYYVNSTTDPNTQAHVTKVDNVTLRNQIQGDFNYDHARNVNDIAGLVSAVQNPRAYQAGIDNDGYVCPEIIGDFNGDGNLDSKDVRIFADGLVIDPNTGNLNRSLGFTAVDNAAANYFGTTLATGKTYAAGDSRADVAGATVVGPGSSLSGADLAVNHKDINYVLSNYGSWSSLSDAAKIDLSCDMNGDMVVNASDLNDVVVTVLGTDLGDINLDGQVDASDLATMSDNWNATLTAVAWEKGDLNGDKTVNSADLAILQANWGK
jgi:hypothetical protein